MKRTLRIAIYAIAACSLLLALPHAAMGHLRDTNIRPIIVTLPTGIQAGDTFTGTVTMDAKATTNTVVALTSSNTSKLTVPASVIVTHGNSTASFTATAVASTTSVSVTASANGGSAVGSMAIQ